MPDKQQIKDKMKELNEVLKEHSKSYYGDDAPTIEDSEWDKYLKELKQLEQQNPELILEDSVTQTVGYNPNSDFKTKVHSSKMLSLGSIFETAELEQFIERVNNHLDNKDKNPEFVVEPKYDGIPVAITYKKGVLDSIITRGNGFEGEDVTCQYDKITNLETKLSSQLQAIDVLELRGEVVISKDALGHYNDSATALGLKPYSDCRNAAAGTLRSREKESPIPMPLCFIIYNVNRGYPEKLKKHSDVLKWISKFKFQVSPVEVYACIDDISESFLRYNTSRISSIFDIDGVVVKVDDMELQDIISNTSREPKWAVAYKFPTDIATSKVIGVNWSISRLGHLTPNAQIAEITLNGVPINTVTLHNKDEIKRLDLHYGDTVRVIRSGDVIPKITDVVKRLRPDNAAKIVPPVYCPSCDSPLVSSKTEPVISCPNILNCKGILTEAFIHFASKDAMDIRGFGEKIIEILVKDGYLHWFSDIFYLYRHKKQLSSIQGLGDKSVDNLLESIEESKTKPLSRLIYGIGIPYVGAKTAQTLANHFVTFESLRNAKPEDFLDLPGIGVGVSEAVLEYMNDANRKIELDALEMSGVNPSKG